MYKICISNVCEFKKENICDNDQKFEIQAFWRICMILLKSFMEIFSLILNHLAFMVGLSIIYCIDI